MDKSVTKDQVKHLVFYDGECGFCDQTVQLLLKVDKKEIFIFAPLQGKTAQKAFQTLPKKYLTADSLILLENFNTPEQKSFLYGKGAFRIMWLLGGAWSLLGWISFLPSFLYDWGYRLIAKYRHLLFPKACTLPLQTHKQRFLP